MYVWCVCIAFLCVPCRYFAFLVSLYRVCGDINSGYAVRGVNPSVRDERAEGFAELVGIAEIPQQAVLKDVILLLHCRMNTHGRSTHFFSRRRHGCNTLQQVDNEPPLRALRLLLCC